MLLIWKEQWLWRGIVAPYQTARLKATQEQWEPQRATQALTDLPPGAQWGCQAPGTPLRPPVCSEDVGKRPPCRHSTLQPQRGAALGGWLSNTDKAKHTREAGCWLRAGGAGAGTRAGPAHAEDTLGCAGCACDVLLGAACWLESWDNWSLLERDFNSAFSRSSKEFLSTNSFICSFRTSTSSLTAYIKWLFTRSCKEQADTYNTGKNSFLHPSLRTYCHCFHCNKPGKTKHSSPKLYE